MKVTVELDITDCNDCVFKRSNYGHGECFDWCSHKDHNQGTYGSIIQENFKGVPEWCPLGIK